MIKEIDRKITDLQAKAQKLRMDLWLKHKEGVSPFVICGLAVYVPLKLPSKKEEPSLEEKQLEAIGSEIDELEAQKKSIRNERLEKIKDPNRLITIDYLKSIVQSLEIEYLVVTYCAQNQIAYVTNEGKPNAIYSQVGVDSEVYTGLTIKA